MTSKTRRHVLAAMLVLWAGATPMVSSAQSYPNKPVQVIVGYPPGSATDFIARLLGQRLAESLGQPFVVENRPGASGVVAATSFVRAAPDGYTIMASVPASTTAARVILGEKLQYAPESDLMPIALVGVSPLVLVTVPESGIRSGADFLAAVQAKKDGVNVGSYGVGSPAHFAIEALRPHVPGTLVHVPHSGPAAMQTAVLGGIVPVAFDSITSAAPLIASGKLVPLAVTAAKRSPSLPDVPTAQEAGLGPIEVAGWVGFHAPKGTPTAVIERLNAEINQALARPDVQKQLGTRMDLAGGSAADFAAFIQRDTARLGRIAQEANLKFE